MFPNLMGQKVYHHLSDEDMAKLVGVSRVTFCAKMQNGRFNVKEIKILCDYFNKNFDFLFATEEEISR